MTYTGCPSLGGRAAGALPVPDHADSAAAEAPGGEPALESASADATGSRVVIRGRNLGAGPPAVELGGEPLRVLAHSGRTVVAAIPPNLRRGRHRLVVRPFIGQEASGQVVSCELSHVEGPPGAAR